MGVALSSLSLSAMQDLRTAALSEPGSSLEDSRSNKDGAAENAQLSVGVVRLAAAVERLTLAVETRLPPLEGQAEQAAPDSDSASERRLLEYSDSSVRNSGLSSFNTDSQVEPRKLKSTLTSTISHAATALSTTKSETKPAGLHVVSKDAVVETEAAQSAAANPESPESVPLPATAATRSTEALDTDNSAPTHETELLPSPSRSASHTINVTTRNATVIALAYTVPETPTPSRTSPTASIPVRSPKDNFVLSPRYVSGAMIKYRQYGRQAGSGLFEAIRPHSDLDSLGIVKDHLLYLQPAKNILKLARIVAERNPEAITQDLLRHILGECGWRWIVDIWYETNQKNANLRSESDMKAAREARHLLLFTFRILEEASPKKIGLEQRDEYYGVDDEVQSGALKMGIEPKWCVEFKNVLSDADATRRYTEATTCEEQKAAATSTPTAITTANTNATTQRAAPEFGAASSGPEDKVRPLSLLSTSGAAGTTLQPVITQPTPEQSKSPNEVSLDLNPQSVQSAARIPEKTRHLPPPEVTQAIAKSDEAGCRFALGILQAATPYCDVKQYVIYEDDNIHIVIYPVYNYDKLAEIVIKCNPGAITRKLLNDGVTECACRWLIDCWHSKLREDDRRKSTSAMRRHRKLSNTLLETFKILEQAWLKHTRPEESQLRYPADFAVQEAACSLGIEQRWRIEPDPTHTNPAYHPLHSGSGNAQSQESSPNTSEHVEEGSPAAIAAGHSPQPGNDANIALVRKDTKPETNSTDATTHGNAWDEDGDLAPSRLRDSEAKIPSPQSALVTSIRQATTASETPQAVLKARDKYYCAGKKFLVELLQALQSHVDIWAYVERDTKILGYSGYAKYYITPQENFMKLARILVDSGQENITWEMLSALREEIEWRTLVELWYGNLPRYDGRRSSTQEHQKFKKTLVEAFLYLDGEYLELRGLGHRNRVPAYPENKDLRDVSKVKGVQQGALTGIPSSA